MGDLSKESQTSLKIELRDEKCTLRLAANGELERVVAVVVLELRRQSGEIFAELGKYKPEKGLEGRCELPGKKRNMGHLPQQSLQSLLQDELAPLAMYVTLEGAQQDVVRMGSAKFGISALYFRTVYRGYMDLGDEEVDLPVATLDPAFETPVARRDVYFL